MSVLQRCYAAEGRIGQVDLRYGAVLETCIVDRTTEGRGLSSASPCVSCLSVGYTQRAYFRSDLSLVDKITCYVLEYNAYYII